MITNAELGALVKKNPIVAICGVLSLAILVGMYLRAGVMDEKNLDLEKKSTDGARYTQNVTNAVQLKEQHDALVAANEAIEARTIRASNLGINQQYFYKLESDSGVKLLELRQGARVTPAANAKYSPLGYSLTAQGDFTQIVSFLRALENGTHYCRVITASCTGGRRGPVTLTLNLELLSRP